jgi:LPS-assembly lipoprotein
MNALKRLLPLAAAAPALMGLAGCGFTPLYAASGVSPKLAAIEVARPDGRAGFLLGQSLDDELGKDATVPPLYRLTVQLKEVRIPRGITVNNEATRYELDMSATYQLIDIKTRKNVTRGTISVNATYNDASQPYAGIAAELDGERRAAESAAQRIRLELASYFASPRPDSPGFDVQGATTATFTEALAPAPVQTPRQRAVNADNPGAGDVPDPYGTGGGVTPP